MPATMEGVLKIPAPITMPTMIATAPMGLNNFSWTALIVMLKS
jgi:hypothetical protein